MPPIGDSLRLRAAFEHQPSKIVEAEPRARSINEIFFEVAAHFRAEINLVLQQALFVLLMTSVMIIYASTGSVRSLEWHAPPASAIRGVPHCSFGARFQIVLIRQKPLTLDRRSVMKYLAFAAITLCALMALIPDNASAVVCARGMYRAGCVGPRGAAVVTRPVYRHGVIVRGARVYPRAYPRVYR